jgi:hypothetical protein
MSGRLIFNGKRQSETVLESFPFTGALGTTETITSATVTASVYSGNDPYPQGIIAGAGTPITAENGTVLSAENGQILLIDPAPAANPPTISGQTVTQLITGGVVGTIYELSCLARTSLSQVRGVYGYYAIVPDLP